MTKQVDKLTDDLTARTAEVQREKTPPDQARRIVRDDVRRALEGTESDGGGLRERQTRDADVFDAHPYNVDRLPPEERRERLERLRAPPEPDEIAGAQEIIGRLSPAALVELSRYYDDLVSCLVHGGIPGFPEDPAAKANELLEPSLVEDLTNRDDWVPVFGESGRWLALTSTGENVGRVLRVDARPA